MRTEKNKCVLKRTRGPRSGQHDRSNSGRLLIRLKTQQNWGTLGLIKFANSQLEVGFNAWRTV
jgi:hypothetical protein